MVQVMTWCHEVLEHDENADAAADERGLRYEDLIVAAAVCLNREISVIIGSQWRGSLLLLLSFFSYSPVRDFR